MDRERQSEADTRVPIPEGAFGGIEFIRQSGATNMLDRPMVLNLAREWGFIETAEWIESVDTGTYGRLIFQGPEIMENEPTDQVAAHDALEQTSELNALSQAWNLERPRVQEVIAALSKQALLTIADTYELEQMGVLLLPQVNAEREVLVRNLGDASRRWLELQESMIEIERGIGSVQYLIDPENN